MTPDEALERLKQGNAMFVRDDRPQADVSTARRLELAKGQAPFAALVGCADSRVGPEHLFGAGLGELFIVRTAGNYLDDAGFGSIAFAVSQLKVPLVVVLGHQHCGAVAAATGVVTENAQLPPSLSRMVQPILPAVIDAKAKLASGEDLIDQSVRNNVHRVVAALRGTSDPIIAAPLAAGHVKIVGAYYELATGAVSFIDD